MTVAELIAKLSEFPPEKRVLVDGYEGGLCHPSVRVEGNVYPTPDAPSYYGPYEPVESWKKPEDYDSVESVVVVGRAETERRHR